MVGDRSREGTEEHDSVVIFVPLSTDISSHVNLALVRRPEKAIKDDLRKFLGHGTSASKARPC